MEEREGSTYDEGAGHGPRFLFKRHQWRAFQKRNEIIGLLFNQFCDEALLSGRKRFSHYLVMNRVRWALAIEHRGPDVEIEEDMIGFYARTYMAADPISRANFFQVKPMIDENFNHTCQQCGIPPRR